MSFSESYAKARTRFRDRATAAGGSLETLAVLEDARHGELTIDVALFGAPQANALMVTSGVHGVEGLAGSAVQVDLVSRGIPEAVRVILVHAVNPYGMVHLRRANENNVDLNRNFLPPGAPYSGCNPGYRALYDLLHPPSPHAAFDLFMARALVEIARHGMPSLRQAVAEGQYEYPKGLFWGGSALERGPRLLLERLPAWTAGAERLALIDLHTGLGRWGTYKLLVNAPTASESYLRSEAAYGDQVQKMSADRGVAYRISGGLMDGVERAFSGRFEGITQEFGTYSPLRVIRALRAENRAHFWGGNRAHAKHLLRDTFYPRSPAWRQRVLEGGRNVLDQALARLQPP